MALDCNDDVPIFLKLRYLNISPNPGISFLINFFTTSGVESLPVKPVPPDSITTFTFLFSISFINNFSICFGSSLIKIFSER